MTNEFKISQDFVWGLKVGGWIGGGVTGMNMGLNLINYTDFDRSSLRIRPEIGFGFDFFRITYGYNFAITNKDLLQVNTHNFGLQFILNVKSIS